MVGAGYAAVTALGIAGQYASGVMSAKARRAEFDEQLRALEMKKMQTLSIARANRAATGTEIGSKSTVDYLAGLADEFDRSISNLRSVRDSTGSADSLTNTLGLVSGGAGLYGNLGQMNNWWR